MQDNFFSNFQSVTTEQWQQQIEKDLKGKPYENLVKETREGIHIKPNYAQAPNLHGAPGEFPYLRGAKITAKPWEIVEYFKSSASNAGILEALNAGVNGVSIEANENIANQLKGVELPYISLFVDEPTTVDSADAILSLIKEKAYDPSTIQGSLGFDPLGYGLVQGKWLGHHDQLIYELTNLVKETQGLSKLRFFTVRGKHFTDAGATAATELGFALAQAHEYLVAGLENGLSIDDIAAKIQFDLGIATDYFVELTKFRVLRRLWARVISAYNPTHSCSHNTYVMGETSSRYFAGADAHSNMIRTTTMVMAAALGGADAVHALPFDMHLNTSAPFGKRIARNVNLILQEESYLHRVLDPAGGSYFLDSLAEELCEKAWEKFQYIESIGGFRKAVEQEKVQSVIIAEADDQLAELKEQKRVMVGVNKFENQLDDLSSISFSEPQIETQFKALAPQRLSETFEKARI